MWHWSCWLSEKECNRDKMSTEKVVGKGNDECARMG